MSYSQLAKQLIVQLRNKETTQMSKPHEQVTEHHKVQAPLPASTIADEHKKATDPQKPSEPVPVHATGESHPQSHFNKPSTAETKETVDNNKPIYKDPEPTPAIQSSRFRLQSRSLNTNEMELHDKIKAKATELEQLYELVPKRRYNALAITALEQSIMWINKEITS
jgi:outer membrane biosynthesis protein TonB